MTQRPVVFYPHIVEFGGIEQNIKSLAEFSSSRGMPLDLVCYYDRVGLQSDCLRVVELGDHKNPFAKAQRCRQWMRQHEDSLAGLPLYFTNKAGFYGALGATPSRRGYALHYTDPPSLLGQNAKRQRFGVRKLRSMLSERITARGVALAERRITMTRWNADELLSCYGYPFDVIYQGGKALKCEGPSCATPGGHHWFSVCRLAASKHLDWILHAAAAFRQRSGGRDNGNLTVTIAGQGPCKEQLERLARELNLAGVVSFPGFLTEEQLEDEFRSASLFLVPARQGFGLPVLEALYRRTPVVLSKESRISEILQENPWAGITAHDQSSFVEATLQLVDRLSNEGLPPEDHLASLPTESGWADQLGQACGWWGAATEATNP